VVIEIPPPIGQTSAGLTGLGFLLLQTLTGVFNPGDVLLLNPRSVGDWIKSVAFKGADRCDIVRHITGRIRTKRPLHIEGEDVLLQDNDAATAYLFYVIESLALRGRAKISISKLEQ
jgi:hypothetical protein